MSKRSSETPYVVAEEFEWTEGRSYSSPRKAIVGAIRLLREGSSFEVTIRTPHEDVIGISQTSSGLSIRHLQHEGLSGASELTTGEWKELFPGDWSTDLVPPPEDSIVDKTHPNYISAIRKIDLRSRRGQEEVDILVKALRSFGYRNIDIKYG